MARIREYDLDTDLSANDYLLGNDGDGGTVITKRFNIADIRDFILEGTGQSIPEEVPKGYIPSVSHEGTSIEKSPIRVSESGPFASVTLSVGDGDFPDGDLRVVRGINADAALEFENAQLRIVLDSLVSSSYSLTLIDGTVLTGNITSYSDFVYDTEGDTVYSLGITINEEIDSAFATSQVNQVTFTDVYFHDVAIDGNLTVDDDLTVLGATDVGTISADNVDLTEAGDTISFGNGNITNGVDGSIDITGDLDVIAESEFTGDVTLTNANLNIDGGNLNIEGQGDIVSVIGNPAGTSEFQDVLTDIQIGEERFHLPLAQSTIASVLPGLLEGLSPTTNEADDEWVANVLSNGAEMEPATFTSAVAANGFQVLNDDTLFFGTGATTDFGFVVGEFLTTFSISFASAADTAGVENTWTFPVGVANYNILDANADGIQVDIGGTFITAPPGSTYIDLQAALGSGAAVDAILSTPDGLVLGNIEPVIDVTGTVTLVDLDPTSLVDTDNQIVTFSSDSIPTGYFVDDDTIVLDDNISGVATDVVDDGTNIVSFTFTYDITQIPDPAIGTMAGREVFLDVDGLTLREDVPVSNPTIGDTGDFWYGTDFGTFTSYDRDISYTFPAAHAVHPGVVVTAVPADTIALGVITHQYGIDAADTYTIFAADNSTAVDITITGEDLDALLVDLFANVPLGERLFFHIDPAALPAVPTTDPDDPAIVQGHVYEVVNYLDGLLSFTRISAGEITVSAESVRFTNLPDPSGVTRVAFIDDLTGELSAATISEIAGQQAVVNYQSLTDDRVNGTLASIEFTSNDECDNIDVAGGSIVVDITGRFTLRNDGEDITIANTELLTPNETIPWSCYVLGNIPIGSTTLPEERTIRLPENKQVGDAIKIANVSDRVPNSINSQASEEWVIEPFTGDRINKLPVDLALNLDTTNSITLVWSGVPDTGWLIT